MLKNLSINKKLMILLAIVFCSLLVMGGAQNKNIKIIERVTLIKSNIQLLNNEMLNLRKHEKDFLMRKNLKYLDKFKKTTNAISKIEVDLKNKLKYFDLNVKEVIDFNNIIISYSNDFFNLVKLQQKIGLNPKDGLYGDLRKNVHLVQAFAKKQDDTKLLSTIYDLRKQEKDFMLRFDKKYHKKFDSKINKLIETNSYPDMLGLLKSYKISFNNLVKLEEEKGLTHNSGLLGNMRVTIHKSDKILKSLSEKINTLSNKEKEEINLYTLCFKIFISILVIMYIFYLSRNISSSLKNFEKGLTQFFSFLNNETKEVYLLDDSKSDELGNMSKIINKNIHNTKNNLEKDKSLIAEATNIANKIKVGHLSNRISKESNSTELNQLKNVINEMLDSLNSNIINIQTVLSKYSKYDYTEKVEIINIEGSILKLCNSVNSLGVSTTEMLVENKKNGLIIDQSSNSLLSNVDTLNQASNEAAASLEETAASLEDVTRNVKTTSERILDMSKFANEVTQSASQGEKLALKTTNAMDEINTQVSSINEAITVIDQIAFQTNILSLNAAVEAATAGEAGKGFAVVAQEVRNLASRSAEAAKEIKNIVENANTKANEGKSISHEMIKGYETLNANIDKTISLISEVSTSSKEQESRIVQINDTINSLDQQTQKNATVANQTKDIALNTSNLAKDIVLNSDQKEFEGKNSIDISTERNAIYKKSISSVKKEQIPKPSTPESKKLEATKAITSNNSSDEWENF